jgi:hypothetical protein
VILDGLGNDEVSPQKVECAHNVLADPEEHEVLKTGRKLVNLTIQEPEANKKG